MQQPLQMGSSETVQTPNGVRSSLSCFRRSTTSARPSLALAEPGVGATPPTAGMTEKFTTSVSTELHTPDIKLEGFMGDKAFPFCSDSNLSKGSSFSLDETGGEMGINREENQVHQPSSTQFPNLPSTLYLDMSPSMLESPQECGDSENGGTEATDIHLPPEILHVLDKIIPNPPYDLASSENVDSRLMETEDLPEFSVEEFFENGCLESVSTPIINDTMMSPTFKPTHQQGPPAAVAASAGHLDPPTISIPEEEESIVPSDIADMCRGFFENETLTGPLEDVEMTENSIFDQNIISNDIDGMELPTSAGQGDLLQRVLQECLGGLQDQNLVPSTHAVQLPPAGGVTPSQSVTPFAAPQITTLTATAPESTHNFVSTSYYDHPIVVRSMVPNLTPGVSVSTAQHSVPVTLIQNVTTASSSFENRAQPTQASLPVVHLTGTGESHTVIQNVVASPNLQFSVQSSQPSTSAEHSPQTSQMRVRRPRRSSKKPLRFQDDILLDESSLQIVEGAAAAASAHTPVSDARFASPGHVLNNRHSGKDHSLVAMPEAVPSTSSGRRRSGRQSTTGMTDEQKYRRTRELNNEASKRCRERRKTKLTCLEQEEQSLLEKNEELKQKVAVLTARKNKMKELVDMVFAKSVQAKYGNR